MQQMSFKMKQGNFKPNLNMTKQLGSKKNSLGSEQNNQLRAFTPETLSKNNAKQIPLYQMMIDGIGPMTKAVKTDRVFGKKMSNSSNVSQKKLQGKISLNN